MQITEVFECHNETVTSQRKSLRLSGKLHCLNFVFPPEDETLGPVCLGYQSSSSSVSLSMLKVPNNGRSTDNVRPDRGLDRSNSRLAGHFDRSFLDTNIL